MEYSVVPFASTSEPEYFINDCEHAKNGPLTAVSLSPLSTLPKLNCQHSTPSGTRRVEKLLLAPANDGWNGERCRRAALVSDKSWALPLPDDLKEFLFIG